MAELPQLSKRQKIFAMSRGQVAVLLGLAHLEALHTQALRTFLHRSKNPKLTKERFAEILNNEKYFSHGKPTEDGITYMLEGLQRPVKKPDHQNAAAKRREEMRDIGENVRTFGIGPTEEFWQSIMAPQLAEWRATKDAYRKAGIDTTGYSFNTPQKAKPPTAKPRVRQAFKRER